MRILKTLAAVALAFPIAASAGITATRHNLTAGSVNLVKAATETDLCKFCHVPHNAQSTRALWNHAEPTTGAGYTWGGLTATSGGTNLPVTLAGDGTRRCLACHDGSTAIGDLIVGATIDVNGAGGAQADLMQGFARIGPNMNGTHPVGVPHAGQTGGIQNTHILWAYNTALNAGCQTSTGICVNGGANGARIPLYGTFGSATIECSSCHEPHSSTYVSFIRVDPAAGGLCLSCHTK